MAGIGDKFKDLDDTPVKSTKQHTSIPLNEILSDYLLGFWDVSSESTYFPSIRELAVKYGCSESYLHKVSSKNKWYKIKTITQAKLKNTRTADDVRKILSISSTQDSRCLENIEKTHDIAGIYLDKLKSITVAMDPDDIDFRYLDRIPNALKAITSTMKEVNALSNLIIGDDDRKQSLYDDLEKIQEQLYSNFTFTEEDDVFDIDKLEKKVKQLSRERVKQIELMEKTKGLHNTGRRKL